MMRVSMGLVFLGLNWADKNTHESIRLETGTATMSEIVKLRVILDAEADVFRDVEIGLDAPLLALHEAILGAFGWAGDEMASFYRSNESWERGAEIPLLAMPGMEMLGGWDEEDEDDDPLGFYEETGQRGSSSAGSGREAMAESMETVTVGAVLGTPDSRAVYVYDFLRMWCFYVEPVAFQAAASGEGYPRCVFAFGEAPAPDSREVDDLGDWEGLGEVSEGERGSTGDPELDAYLDDDDGDWGEEGPEFTDLEGLDEHY
jgi:hypothetical protein